MILLAIAILVFAGTTWYIQSSNSKLEQSLILYPFSGYLSPSSSEWTVNTSKTNKGVSNNPEGGLYLVGMAGGEKADVPQITCPVGTKINIVGAYLDIVDPYAECSNVANPTLALSCGIASDTTNAPSCKSGNDSSCGPGMKCPAGKCVPIDTCTSNKMCGSSSTTSSIIACPTNLGKSCKTTPCGDPTLVCLNDVCVMNPGTGPCMVCVDIKTGDPIKEGMQGSCAAFPSCQNTTNGLNKTCSPSLGDSKLCRPRDASAYLANHCDGKNVCIDKSSDIWLPNSLHSVFGPLPCEIPAMSTNTDYVSLPISVGWGGGSSIGSAGGSAPITFNQGYYVHGVYTCQPI